MSAFVDRHTRAWETVSGIAACGFLAAAFYNDQHTGLAGVALVSAFTAVFVAEFAARCWDAPSRWGYAQRHWLDLVSCVPVVGGLRAIRLLRVAKVLLVARAARALDSHVAERASLAFVGPLLVLAWVGGAIAAWILEHGVNPAMRTFGDALYWTFITATTVGYGDVRPVTPEGRVLAGLLAFTGIGLLGFASAQLTARFLHHQGQDLAASARELRALRAEVAELRAFLEGPVDIDEGGPHPEPVQCLHS